MLGQIIESSSRNPHIKLRLLAMLVSFLLATIYVQVVISTVPVPPIKDATHHGGTGMREIEDGRSRDTGTETVGVAERVKVLSEPRVNRRARAGTSVRKHGQRRYLVHRDLRRRRNHEGDGKQDQTQTGLGDKPNERKTVDRGCENDLTSKLESVGLEGKQDGLPPQPTPPASSNESGAGEEESETHPSPAHTDHAWLNETHAITNKSAHMGQTHPTPTEAAHLTPAQVTTTPASAGSVRDDGGGEGEQDAEATPDGNATKKVDGEVEHDYEDIPSFVEWTKQKLEEQEQLKSFGTGHGNGATASVGNGAGAASHDGNGGGSPAMATGGTGNGKVTLHSKRDNYASVECGGKILASKPRGPVPSSYHQPQQRPVYAQPLQGEDMVCLGAM